MLSVAAEKEVEQAAESRKLQRHERDLSVEPIHWRRVLGSKSAKFQQIYNAWRILLYCSTLKWVPVCHWNQESSSIWERICSTAHMSDLCRDAWQVEMSQWRVRMRCWAFRASPKTVARCHYTHLKMDGRCKDEVKSSGLCHKRASFYLQYGHGSALLPWKGVQPGWVCSWFVVSFALQFCDGITGFHLACLTLKASRQARLRLLSRTLWA